MGWADNVIAALARGETVKFRPRGGSMKGKIESGQQVTVTPIAPSTVNPGDIVLCKVGGKQYLHLVKARQGDRLQIGNNKGHINGWTNEEHIYGIVIYIEA